MKKKLIAPEHNHYNHVSVQENILTDEFQFIIQICKFI